MEKFLDKYCFTTEGRNKTIEFLGWFGIVGGIAISIMVFIAIYLRDA